MPRLIDADALKEQVMSEIRRYWLEEWGGYYRAEDVIPDIENAPTVDAVPVAPGRWEWKYGAEGTYTKHCSVCGSPCPFTEEEDEHGDYQLVAKYIEANYCPNCGARMDGGNEDA